MAAPDSDKPNFITQEWYVVNNDIIGGWSVSNVNKPISEHEPDKGECDWIDTVTEEIAKYIVEIHENYRKFRDL